jgi:single-strand DNA-binding protein
MNIAIFTGRLGKDATLNRISSGDPVCNFSVAVDVGTKQNPQTLWVECAVYGKRSESLHQYLTKGKEVTVHGRVTLDTFTSRDGTPKSGMKLNVNEINFHGGRDAQTQQTQQPGAAAAPAAAGMDDMENDIPF